ncbi:sulfatase family protein [Paenibacillus sp. strain BS8-2]
MINKPNMVLFTVDQLAAASLHCYGGKTASTPNIDGLANRGMRFDRFYAHSPLCAPNRASIYTGRSTEIHGITRNNLVLTEDLPTFAHVLKGEGYRTGAFGKFHLTPMQRPLPKDFAYLGFDQSIGTEDSKLGPWLDWVEREHPAHFDKALAVSWPMPYISEYGEEGRNLRPAWDEAHEKYMKPLREQSDWRLMYGSPLPKELHQTTYITDVSLQFMGKQRREHPEQPFFCHVSYVDPHDPYDPPAPYDTMYKPEDMEAAVPRAKEHYDYSPLEDKRDFHGFRGIADDEAKVKKLRALYQGSLTFLDDQIGRLIMWLEEEGLMDNTVILFTSDHGDMLGDHGFITKGLMHYDKSIRCPLIVSGAGITKGSTDRLSTSLDLFPSLCELGGAAGLPPVEGLSFIPTCGGLPEAESWSEVTVQLERAKSIVTDDGWRLTVYNEQGKGQMFNLQEDPDEQRDLYHVSEWLWKKAELLERMTRAHFRPMETAQYRNLPIINGMKSMPSEEVHAFRSVFTIGAREGATRS